MIKVYPTREALAARVVELQQELDICRRALRAHHDWSTVNIVGYCEGGNDQLIYRATVIALGANEAALHLKTPLTVPNSG